MTPFLSLRNCTDATNAYLTVVQTRTAALSAATGNEAEVGRGVDSLPSRQFHPDRHATTRRRSIRRARRSGSSPARSMPRPKPR
jgi:hypothetical protein